MAPTTAATRVLPAGMAVLPDDPDAVAIAAPAKLNLSLAILARRSDGFHEIESLMVPVSLADRLVVRAVDTPGVRLRVRFGGRLAQPAGAVLCRDVPADDSNLVVRAARRLAEVAGIERGLNVELTKEVPSGAGLGGGSSDAAAMLRAAAVVWGLDWPTARLAEIGAGIGSDVPWFFAGIPAIAAGRGERIEPVAGLPPLHAVIACPAAGLSTPAVYGRCVPDQTRAGETARLVTALARGDLRAAGELMHNGLEAAARSLSADIDRLLAALSAAGAVRPMLTGSGSACFAITRTDREARAIAARLDAAGWPGVFAVRVGGSPVA
ncbi:MAG: 4-(cytidine 5'-diphospho)-2-C-methyl-D-erythritol kinase [Planctomycetia bacterium]